ncbi:hypothetical protein BJ170DRAFT_701522 [Xylariales sp. AK1849]|nr:hypothetical protein BJ170DRAFT_701522 [Xylariales sp. AK1849]
METQSTGDAKPSGRKRRAGVSGTQHTCQFCGRTFKRSEHKERHVRTHTKEKPFVCRCGAAFTRRDLLTRHQRIVSHQHQNLPGQVLANAAPKQVDPPAAEADMAAAVSLSGMSANPWVQQPSQTGAFPPDSLTAGEPPQVLPELFQQPSISQEFFDQGQDVSGQDHFREFANFLDGVGLPAEDWSQQFPPGPEDDLVDPQLRESGHEAVEAANAVDRSERSGSPFNCWLPSAPQESRSADANKECRPRDLDAASQPFRITEDQCARLGSYLESFRDIVDNDFTLPSRHALTRYVTSYFQGFHLHMPFIHQKTWRILDAPLELVLAVSTMGAQYCFEHRNSEKLFQAGKAVLLARLLHETEELGPKTKSFLTMHNYFPLGGKGRPSSRPSRPSRDLGLWEAMDTVRALIILMGFATWERKEAFVAEAFFLQSLLVQVLRDIGLVEEAERDDILGSSSLQSAWVAWVRQESVRRAKLIAFTFLHIHSVAYNVYPVLRSNEIHLRLPSSTGEWKASTASQWHMARRKIHKEQLNFQDALSLLLRHDGTAPLEPIPTPLGNYCLLHGLLQRIHIVRDLSLPIMNQSASLPSEEVSKLERGLRSWTSGWQQQPESSLDPNNENGPIPFTSSSLLALAYVRIYLNLGPYRQLDSRDPSGIARALCMSPKVERSNGVISALLYATHALSIPVRLGVDRVARSQAFFWSVRHSLSGLECAVLLSKWLNSVSVSLSDVPLTENEARILHWVQCIVGEAYAVVDFGEEEPMPLHDPAGWSLAVLRIWAHFFKSNTQWPFINMIGISLERYREMLLQGIIQRPS